MAEYSSVEFVTGLIRILKVLDGNVVEPKEDAVRLFKSFLEVNKDYINDDNVRDIIREYAEKLYACNRMSVGEFEGLFGCQPAILTEVWNTQQIIEKLKVTRMLYELSKVIEHRCDSDYCVLILTRADTKGIVSKIIDSYLQTGWPPASIEWKKCSINKIQVKYRDQVISTVIPDITNLIKTVQEIGQVISQHKNVAPLVNVTIYHPNTARYLNAGVAKYVLEKDYHISKFDIQEGDTWYIRIEKFHIIDGQKVVQSNRLETIGEPFTNFPNNKLSSILKLHLDAREVNLRVLGCHGTKFAEDVLSIVPGNRSALYRDPILGPVAICMVDKSPDMTIYAMGESETPEELFDQFESLSEKETLLVYGGPHQMRSPRSWYMRSGDLPISKLLEFTSLSTEISSLDC